MQTKPLISATLVTRTMKLLVAVTIFTGLLVSPEFAGAAFVPEVEPNGNQIQANGPLTGVGILGSLATNNDVDYYTAFVAPQRQVTLTYELVDGTCVNDYTIGRYRAELSVTTVSGTRIWGTEVSPGSDMRQSYGWTTPDQPTALYLKFGDGDDFFPRSGCQYTFSITPVDALLPNLPVPTPAPPVAKPNCRLGPNAIKRGQRIYVVCRNVASGQKLEVRWQRRTGQSTKRLASRSLTIRDDLGKISSKAPKRGTYKISLWLGPTKVGQRTVRIR